MTLVQAAELLGYADTSALRHAARRGLLKTDRVGKMHVTTREWLDAYTAHVQANRGGRGKKRGPRRPTHDTEAAPE